MNNEKPGNLLKVENGNFKKEIILSTAKPASFFIKKIKTKALIVFLL